MANALALAPDTTGQKPRRGRPTLSNEQLLDKALDLFLEQGFERTSIEAICAAAGMAKRTVYARYADKASLFQAAMQRAIAEWIVPIDRLREAETDDFEQTLLALGRILVANLMSPAGIRLLRLTSAVSAQMPDIGAMNVRLGTDPTLAYLTDLFRRHWSNYPADAPDVELAARAYLDLVVGGPSNASAWGVSIEPEEVERHMRFRVRMMMQGLEPRDTGSANPENQRLRAVLAETQTALVALSERLSGI